MEKTASKVRNLLNNYKHYKDLAEETEELRNNVDSLMHDDADDADDALRLMIEIDTNMLELMDYHVMLSTNCLKLLKCVSKVEV